MVPVSLYVSLWQYLLSLLWSGIYNLVVSCRDVGNRILNESNYISQEIPETFYIDFDI